MARGDRTIGQTACATLALGLAFSLALGGCDRKAPSAAEGGQPAATAAGASPCPASTSPLNSVLPGTFGDNAAQLGCFAWQSFVAVNWLSDPANPGYPDPAAGPGTFGLPNATRPSVWESYLEA
jgi:hypothetical protein